MKPSTQRLLLWLCLLALVAGGMVLNRYSPDEDGDSGGACAVLAFGLLALLLVAAGMDALLRRRKPRDGSRRR